jgi:ribosomal protein S18 acetylase RimI-like enzyme
MIARSSSQCYTLRPATSADQGFLFRVYASTRWEELAPVPWSDAQKREFLAQQAQAQHDHYQRHYADAEFLVVQIDGHDAGRVYIHWRPGEIRIVELALLPEYRGQEVGTRILNEVLGEARKTGRVVSIHVEKNNPALRLYRRLGFVEAADVGVYWLLRWDPTGAVQSGVEQNR